MRALALDPNVLLMDEPLGALDPMIRTQLQHQLRAIFQSLGKTVVLVTHDLNEAAYFADQIVLMQTGRIVQKGSIDDLFKRPASEFVTEFIEAQQSHFAAASGGMP
jgi:osmoprotectant transport system ATP-binding protein